LIEATGFKDTNSKEDKDGTEELNQTRPEMRLILPEDKACFIFQRFTECREQIVLTGYSWRTASKV
jgi:hypothetical protein